MQSPEVRRQDLVYPDLSYIIVGCAYDVFNELGGGLPEKFYQRGFAKIFEIKKIPFRQQVYFPLKIKGHVIAKTYFDFLVFEKVIVELKKDNKFSRSNIEQVNSYLKISGLKLALLINFTSDGVVFRRLVNIEGKL